MRKKRVMIVGPTGCGKTSLAKALEEQPMLLRKAPEPIYGERTIDCPGAYLENVWMYKHLITLAQDASHVLLIMDAASQTDLYSPNFAQVMVKPVTGIITKLDVAPENEEFCRERLRQVGVRGEVFCVNAQEKIGVQELKAYLFQAKGVEAKG